MSKKILIIDDEPHIVKVLKSRLEANDYEVIVAFDGEEGLKKLQDEGADLIILDIMMPKMDGFTFIKKLEKNLRQIPIIVLTAKAEMKNLFEIEKVEDYMLKPFEPEELMEKVAKCLK